MATNFLEHFRVYHADFQAIIGSKPTCEVLIQIQEYPFAHEAGVYFDRTRELFVTSNQFADPGSSEKRAQISKISLGDGTSCSVKLDEIP